MTAPPWAELWLGWHFHLFMLGDGEPRCQQGQAFTESESLLSRTEVREEDGATEECLQSSGYMLRFIPSHPVLRE